MGLCVAATKPTMAAPCPLLGDGITDATLLNIVRFLPTIRDLLCLRLTHTKFCTKTIATHASGITRHHRVEQRQRRRCCASRRRQRGCGWWGAASRSVAGCLDASLRAGCA